MDLGKLPLFSMMSQRLSWLGKRQEVLAQNVANADTPGYRMRELKEQNFRELVAGARSGVTMAATSAQHIGAKAGPGGGFKTEVRRDADISLSNNSVDIEDQMMKVAQTAMDHQVTVNLYRKHVAMLKAALGRPGG